MIIDEVKKICFDNKEKVFYKNSAEVLTYGELWNEASILSSKIPNLYKEPIIIYGNKEKKVLISFLACLLSGNAYIPVNTNTPINRIKKIITSSNSKYVINSTSSKLKLKDISDLENKDVKYSNNPNDPAYIIYTSGSSGDPKGVLITKENLNNFIYWINNVIPKVRVKKVLNTADFSFDLSVCDIYFSLLNGLCLIGLENKDIDSLFNTIHNEQVDVIVATPTFIKLCLMDQRFNSKNIKSLKTIFFCGERLEKNVVKKLFDRFNSINIINAYGPTEACCAVSSVNIKKRHLNYDLLPVGKLNDSAVKIDIINDEIILIGKSVSNGYINLNSSNFYKEGNLNVYKTGDIGYVKDDYLFCKGRIDNQIKYKGYRIELEEIEEALNSIYEIKDSLVVTKNIDNKPILIEAFVSLNSDISTNKIKEKLKDIIPGYMIPKVIRIVDEIPINKNIKKDRRVNLDEV